MADIQKVDLEAVRLIAGDGYSVEIPSEIIQNHTIIFAYERDCEPLVERSQPLRAFISGCTRFFKKEKRIPIF